jgi:hypothetical protein
MLQFPERVITDPPSLSLVLLPNLENFCDDSSSQTGGDAQKSPTISENFSRLPGYASSVSSETRTSCIINAAVAARKRGNLSHLSESDRRSEFSYRSESISVAVSDSHNRNTGGSKFKVVKLGDKIPYVRGRFVCFDFHDIPNVKDGGGRIEVNGGGAGASLSRMQTPDMTGAAVVGAGGTLTSGWLPSNSAAGASCTVGVLDSLENASAIVPTQGEFYD